MEQVPDVEPVMPLDDDTVECVAEYDDEEEPCGYRGPFSEFVRCGKDEVLFPEEHPDHQPEEDTD